MNSLRIGMVAALAAFSPLFASDPVIPNTLRASKIEIRPASGAEIRLASPAEFGLQPQVVEAHFGPEAKGITALPVYLQRVPLRFQDDGKAPDRKAGDGVFTATVSAADLAGKASPASVPGRFEGRHLALAAGMDAKAALSKVELKSLAGSAQQVIDRVLMVRNSNVVNHANASGMGVWSFGYLMSKLAGQQGVDPDLFVRRWIQHFTQDQSVNGFPSKARTNAKAFFDAWPTRADGSLDLERSPFRLCAIVHRIDLRGDVILGGSDSAGENRMVYCAVNDRGEPLSFTVIFEYGIGGKGSFAEVRAEAEAWAQLNIWDFSDPLYIEHMTRLTEAFVNPADYPTSGNRLDQLRTNEISLDSPWQLREFKISPPGTDDAGLLRQVTVKQTPADSLNDTQDLRDWVQANAAGINAQTLRFPREINHRTPLLGAHSDVSGQWLTTGPVFNPRETRHMFALQTCNGCHSSQETATSFTHVSPRAANSESGLSPFLTGTVVNDTVDPGQVHIFADLARRLKDFEDLLAQPAILELTRSPLLMEH
jgi:hypothetical protein